MGRGSRSKVETKCYEATVTPYSPSLVPCRVDRGREPGNAGLKLSVRKREWVGAGALAFVFVSHHALLLLIGRKKNNYSHGDLFLFCPGS